MQIGHIPMSAQPPSGWRLWMLAARPHTLTISVAPVIAGTALAWSETGRFDPGPGFGALIGALLIQAGANLHNDAVDALRGGDLPTRQGPARVTARGWIPARRVIAAAQICLALAAVVGLYLIACGGLPILILGIASLIGGWCYSGGPRPISYGPYGELFVVAFFGIGAVGGSYYLQTGTLSLLALETGVAIGLFAAAVLMVNNYRDIEADRIAGRNTLAIQAGIPASRVLYSLFLLVSFGLLAGPMGPNGGWVTLAGLPLAIDLIHRFVTLPRGSAFNPILGKTARLQLIVAVLFAVGINLGL
ncbi:1,4-dihydroxy-2-naphthoate octaprenyltransferase [Magnetospirillum molischianum]|uniref:1,4-dihydroxy-2-naphthoate octaprenyltransferase n=1 Tax=Magnetospirillum molischianum DSM 120 TaxID=1150626 RepID=H8FUG1_MAGML|nr:1,4-dihydroxy-2-naphthoate octaprenyltransferase [Magnetospirillum molischianum]CCG41999.1 putative 1,4-dihydroxy-2-naphthoate octaprenyltransferase [Magnetospirillum molischianum DSM 120]